MNFDGVSKRPGKLGETHATIKLTAYPDEVDSVADLVRVLCESTSKERKDVLAQLKELTELARMAHLSAEVVAFAKQQNEVVHRSGGGNTTRCGLIINFQVHVGEWSEVTCLDCRRPR